MHLTVLFNSHFAAGNRTSKEERTGKWNFFQRIWYGNLIVGLLCTP